MNQRRRLLAFAGLGLTGLFASKAESAPVERKHLPVYAKDYQTSTGLYPGDGTVVTVRAKGVWGIWGSDRRCSAAGDAEAHENEHGHWPVEGVPEGTLLIWFGNQVHYWKWQMLAPNDYQVSFTFQGNDKLQLGPNDNHLEDNANGGYLDVYVLY